MQNGVGQTLLADAVINDILKEAIAAARADGVQQRLRGVARIPPKTYANPPAAAHLEHVLAEDPAPLAAAGGRRQ
jgi:hypothetical protein